MLKKSNVKKWQYALVTGAADGIGKALCKQLLDSGVQVTAIDKNTISWAKKYDDNVLKIIYIDLVNSNSVNYIISQFDQNQKYDLIIHNAGISATGKFEDIDPQAYVNLIRINLFVPIEMSVLMMREGFYAPNANLVFISSLSHVTGYPGASVYGAGKGALAIYAKSIYTSFSSSGIAVTSVFPGPVQTDHAQRHAPSGARAKNRMQPDILANKILISASKNAKTLYPGALAKFARLLGALAPRFITNLMRKTIYDKLDRPVW